MSRRGEVLVAILNHPHDLEIARDHHWYRIPVESVEQRLKKYWPPDWIAFYQTKIFGSEAYSIRYYAQIKSIQKTARQALFPTEPVSPKSEQQYYRLILSSLEGLPQSIISVRRRRITFIPTTLVQLMTAIEIQDLYPESDLKSE